MSGRAAATLGRLAVVGLVLLGLAGCGSSQPQGVYKLGRPYQVSGRWYRPEFDPHYDRVGLASWYGPHFDGRRTANGEVFDPDEISAAHPTLPMPSIVEVTNLENGRSLELRVNDRGPFVGERIIDLSQAAARELGFERRGTAKVRVRYLRLAEDARGRPPEAMAAAPERPAPASTPTLQVATAAPPTATPVAGPSRPAVPAETGARSAAATATPFQVATRDVCAPRFIQVGAFSESARAHQVAMQLLGLAVPVSMEPSGTNPYARVRLGPIADRGTAESTLHWLKRQGYDGAFLVAAGGTEPWDC